MTSAGSVALGYDGRGNLTQSGSSAYGYTAENRLVSGPGGAGFVYDPTGRLYQSSGTATGITRFAYDGTDLAAEYNSANGVLRRYVHGPGDDEPLVWYEGSGTTDRRWYHQNEQSSVIGLSNSAGTMFAINAYDEYGIPASTNLGRFAYTGQTWLPELGMYYYKARIYSPTLGRFLQTDPIGYGDGINWYDYVDGDPVNREDTTGLCPSCIGALVGAAIEYGTQVGVNLAQGQSLRQAATNVDGKSIVVAAALGAVGGFGGGTAARLALKGASIATKGKIGEGVARAGIALKGGRVIASQTRANQVGALAGQVSGRGGRAVPDFVVKTLTGKTVVVEAKFGTSQLTGAQRVLRDQVGSAFRVSRTTSKEVENVAGAVGGAVAEIPYTVGRRQ